MTNPLVEKKFRVPFDQIEPEHLRPAVDQLIAQARADLDAVAKQEGPRNYDNTLGAMEEATDTLIYAVTIMGHLESVAMTDAYRDAYNDVQEDISAFFSSIVLHEGLWHALKEYAETEDARSLDHVKRRFLVKTMDDFRRQGADLGPEQKQELQKIDVRLSELTTRYAQNVLDATNRYELIVTDESKLAGLPQSARDAAAESARKKGVEGFRFTLQAPSYIAVQQYLDDESIRRDVWRAYNTRGTAAPNDNRPLLVEILKLRKKKAELLDFRDFADLVLADRMAKNGRAATEFLNELRRRTRPFFDKENDELRAFKKQQTGSSEMQPWDIAYWSEKQRKALYEFDEEELRPYFTVENVLQGVFHLVETLYGVTIEPSEAPTWDDAVRVYKVCENGTHLGSFYADLFPREIKRGGAWMNGIITATPGEPHLGLICANATPAVGDNPPMLTHREVETIFHEFGHLLHHLLSDVPVVSLGGTNVAWDFVELPSQIMENWCWERSSLDSFARHYETGEPIPDDLFSKLERARTYRAAYEQMRQIGYGTADLMLHRDFDPYGDNDVIAYARKIFEEHNPCELPSDYAMIASFNHLFASPVAYAAGYYSYKWAEVLDADAFTRFKKEGVFDREVGMSFRNEILSRGDSDDPARLFENFMGRPPDIEALMQRQGLC